MELISATEIAKLFPIGGMILTQLNITEHSTDYLIGLHITGKGKDISLEIQVPRPVQWFEEHPLFDFFGVYKAIAYRAQPDPMFSTSRSFHHLHVETPGEVLIDTVRRAIAKSLDSDEPQATAQRTIDSFFGANELVRNVDIHKPLDVEAGVLTLVIDCPTSTDWHQYQYNHWEGLVDYITGTQGEKIGHTFKLCKGVRVINGRLFTSNNLFSSLMCRCVVFPENDRPNRLLITRPAFANHEELIKAEDPLVAHTSYNGEFKGIHLLTGIINHPDNYQDCIIISKSAAEKLACHVRKKVTVQDTGVIVPLQGIGDNYPGGAMLAEVYDHEENHVDELRNPHKTGTWNVEDIVWSDTLIGGELGRRVRFHLSTVYTCETGDKLTTRHGGKGVVKVVPDDQMPTVNGHPLEALVHPMSFNSRRNLGTFREMMVNKKFMSEYLKNERKVTLRVNHFDTKYSMKELVEEGFGNPDKVTYKGEQIDCFIGPLYWLRTDKHAREQMSCVTGNRHFLNEDGLKPDSGRISGKRMSMNYSTILQTQGMTETHRAIVKSSTVPQSLRRIARVLKCLDINDDTDKQQDK